MLDPSKKLGMDLYAGADFVGLWGLENHEDPICDRSRTGFVVTSS